MKKKILLIVTTVLLMFAASYGQSKQPDHFLIVPGERVGLFFLEQSYAPVEKLYQGYGYSQEIDDWLDVNIFSNSETIISFSPMFVTDSDERIPNTVGQSLVVFSSDFRTQEGVGVGSSLRELLNCYPNYTIEITFIPEEDYTSLERKEFTSIESFVEYLVQNSFDGIDPDGTSFICLDAKGERSGINFGIEINQTTQPASDTFTKESNVTRVFIHTQDWAPEPDIWM
jgi:hypothetical protein